MNYKLLFTLLLVIPSFCMAMEKEDPFAETTKIAPPRKTPEGHWFNPPEGQKTRVSPRERKWYDPPEYYGRALPISSIKTRIKELPVYREINNGHPTDYRVKDDWTFSTVCAYPEFPDHFVEASLDYVEERVLPWDGEKYVNLEAAQTIGRHNYVVSKTAH